MRRTASEVIRELEKRVARLERQASNRTASMKIKVSISTGSPMNKEEMMTVKELLSLVKSKATGRDVVNIIPHGSTSRVNFICPDIHWSCSVNMHDLIDAIEADHPADTEALLMNAYAVDEEDDKERAMAVSDWLGTSRGSFGGYLGRGWVVKII